NEHDDVGDLRAARTHGRERFVARRVEERDVLPTRQRDVVGADVLRDTAGLTGDDVGLADVVEQRRLAVVDVAHDRNNGWARLELLLGVFDGRRRLEVGGVFLLLHCLETEFAGDELDLIEVEALVDGDHQPEVLEGKADDLDGGHLEDLRQLADGDELIDADRFLLALDFSLTLSGELLAVASVLGTARSAAAYRTTHRRHRLADVRLHCFLIHSALAFLAAATTAILTTTGATIFAARRRSASTGCC